MCPYDTARRDSYFATADGLATADVQEGLMTAFRTSTDARPGADNPHNRDYFPRLDGLRAVAIMLVMAQHFYRQGFSLGENGVTLFFVISAFLITSILLEYPPELSVGEAARTFYLQRALRLVPVYYLCIALAAALDLGGMRETWWLDALWLTNFRVALAGAWGSATHFWSLAVEEQFYLVWFAVVVMTPRRFLPAIIVSFLAVGPLWRRTMIALDRPWFSHIMLPGVIDSMAIGALLAYANRFSTHTLLWKRFEQVRMPAILLFLATVVVSEWLGTHSIFVVNLLSVCLVSAAADTKPDWRVNWLAGKAISHLGRISYSLYVFHYFVRQSLDDRWAFWSKIHELNLLTRFVVLAVISIAIAEISWQLIEKPIKRLKSKIAIRRNKPIMAPVEQAIEHCRNS